MTFQCKIGQRERSKKKKFSFSSLHSVSLASTRSVLYPIQCPMTVMKTKKNLIFLARFSHSKERDLSLSYIVAHLQSLLAREHNLNQHKSRIWQALTTIDDSMLRISCSLVSLCLEVLMQCNLATSIQSSRGEAILSLCQKPPTGQCHSAARLIMP